MSATNGTSGRYLRIDDEILDRIMQSQGFKPTTLCVYVVVARIAGRSGGACTAMRAAIARQAGLGTGTVVKAISWLKSIGVLIEAFDNEVRSGRRLTPAKGGDL